MANSTLDVTQPLHTAQTLLRIVDNGDGTYSLGASVSGGATSSNQSLELVELRGMNILSSVVFDSILVSYTDATKTVISKVEWKLGATVIKTLTPTFGSTTDNWVKT